MKSPDGRRVHIGEQHPWGRVLKALRIVDRIQEFADTSSEKIPYERFLTALDNPVRPNSVAILKEFADQEVSWPSADTFRLTAELLTKWYISPREADDVEINTSDG
ncbi:MAG: hypothetical protein ABL876_00030 [Chitinophagaceae bacterium]